VLALPIAAATTEAEPDPPTGGTTTTDPPPPPVDWQARYEAEHERSQRRLAGWRRAERRALLIARRARRWRRVAISTLGNVRANLLCIHGGEGSWRDSGDPYWGGLQMDRQFQLTYGRALVMRFGWASNWPAAAQLAVGEVAVYSGRGYGPWPNTRKPCGL
jgi:hypothetical protein